MPGPGDPALPARPGVRRGELIALAVLVALLAVLVALPVVLWGS